MCSYTRTTPLQREREERRAPRAAYLEVSGREGAYIASKQMCLRSCSRSSHGTRSIAAGPARSTINYEPTPPSPLSRRRQQRRYRPVFLCVFILTIHRWTVIFSSFLYLALSFFLYDSSFVIASKTCNDFRSIYFRWRCRTVWRLSGPARTQIPLLTAVRRTWIWPI